MLPQIDGLEVCRRLRRRRPVAVIMLTARGDEDDRVMGLELGADDYVSKPFSPRELTARVQAVLRRARRRGVTSSGRGVRGRDRGRRSAHRCRGARGDAAASGSMLTAREFDLLVFLGVAPSPRPDA